MSVRENIELIYKTLAEYHVYPEYVGQYSTLPVYMVTIDGDWKHDHWCAKEALADVGFSYFKEESLPSDSDWYTATHYYFKV